MAGGTITEVDLAEPQSGAFRLTLTEQGINHRLSTAVSQSIEVVRRRVDELGTTEPVIQRQGVDRIMVQVPGLQDPARLKALLNQTAQLTFRLVDLQHSAEAVAAGQQPAPAGSQLLYTTDNPAMPILVQRQVMVSGENLTDAQAGFDQQTNAAVVNIRFDSRGAQRFGAVTQQNVGRPSPSSSTTRSCRRPISASPSWAGRRRFRAISPCRRPTTWPFCCAPARCRQI